MANERERQLEELIHREFRRLPAVPAPATLVHRVMLTVHERARQPWWRRSWAGWPTPVRLLFLVGATAFACVCMFSLVYLGGEVSLASVMTEAGDQVSFLRPVWEVAAALAGALVWLARAASPVLVWSVILTLGAIYLTSVGLGTLCYRVALNKV
jgi:hypothetical protein